jgi:hypothetical protein
MRWLVLIMLLAVAGNAAACPARSGTIGGDVAMISDSGDHGRSDPLPGPPDDEATVREEYDAAIAAGTAEALSLFIRRHYGHPLADKAEQALNDLVSPERPE